MHNRGYYRNSNGDFDPHAYNMAWKKHHNKIKDKLKEEALTDGDTNYTMDVENTLGVNVEGLNTNRKNTKLALRQPLSIVPRDEIAGALREGNFSIVPMKNTLPAPVKPNQIRLAA